MPSDDGTGPHYREVLMHTNGAARRLTDDELWAAWVRHLRAMLNRLQAELYLATTREQVADVSDRIDALTRVIELFEE
jgi:hypothetical protein